MNDRNENPSLTPEFPGFPNCFVCGKDNPRGLRTSFHPEGDGVAATFNPDKTLVGYEDAIHGGIISALLDEAIIWACYAKTGRFGVTAELIVRFIKPMLAGNTFQVIGRMVKDMGKLWIAEGEIVHEKYGQIAVVKGKIIPKN